MSSSGRHEAVREGFGRVNHHMWVFRDGLNAVVTAHWGHFELLTCRKFSFKRLEIPWPWELGLPKVGDTKSAAERWWLINIGHYKLTIFASSRNETKRNQKTKFSPLWRSTVMNGQHFFSACTLSLCAWLSWTSHRRNDFMPLWVVALPYFTAWFWRMS